jgi:hypothetical protein
MRKTKKVLGIEVNWVSDHEIVLTQTDLKENLALAPYRATPVMN